MNIVQTTNVAGILAISHMKHQFSKNFDNLSVSCLSKSAKNTFPNGTKRTTEEYP